MDTSKKISEIPEWFCGCRLNFAENLLKYPDDDKVAIITCGEHKRFVLLKLRVTFRRKHMHWYFSLLSHAANGTD